MHSLRSSFSRKVYTLLPTKPVLTRPVFIVGCGRSGTTILGKLLSQHSQLAYLNEPRHIWRHEPQTDIWSENSQLNGGKLMLTATDFSEAAATRIYNAFAVEVRTQGKHRLVEKLPINSFRIEFINRLFPEALFIHIIRNGIEVAHSIAEFSNRKPWFGYKEYKWRLLAKYAIQKGYGSFVDLCTDNILRGMLEWRLSVLSALEGLNNLSDSRKLEIRYEDLVQDPLSICKSLENFIGVKPDSEMQAFAVTEIKRKVRSVDLTSINNSMYQIGGSLLAELGYL